MTPRRLDRAAIRARLEHLPGWVVEALLDDFEPAALSAIAAAEKKRQPKKPEAPASEE